MRAATRKSVREGKNKKREKCFTISIAMENAILSDLDHQMSHSVGCQIRLAFYIMCRIGTRGGLELWNMKLTDLKIKADATGKEYIEYFQKALFLYILRSGFLDFTFWITYSVS
jgi:hypothetical protein